MLAVPPVDAETPWVAERAMARSRPAARILRKKAGLRTVKRLKIKRAA